TTATGAIADKAYSIELTDASAFSVGSIILVESVARIDDAEDIYPLVSFLNTVVYKSGNTVYLKYPANTAVGATGGNPKVYLVPTEPNESSFVSATSADVGNCFVAVNASIKGLRFHPSDAQTSSHYDKPLYISAYLYLIEIC